tara:strand:- start:231 stop:764 length:534 start_codon:yes stop_codon:yes gene_type:complete
MKLIFLFMPFFIYSYEFPELLVKNQKFSSNITISDSESIISEGYITYQNDDFIYTIYQPDNQILAGINGQLFIQDNDFRQVMIYQDDDSFFVKRLLVNSYLYEQLVCADTSKSCYRLDVNDERIDDAILIFKDDMLHEIHIWDFQNTRFLVKFDNYVLESTNISYEPPDEYELIVND